MRLSNWTFVLAISCMSMLSMCRFGLGWMIFDSEAMWSWFGKVNDADMPSTFKIRSVRTWRQAADATRVLPDTRPSAAK
jgi:hypothetical protein